MSTLLLMSLSKMSQHNRLLYRQETSARSCAAHATSPCETR